MKRKSNCLATILFLIYLALLVWIILFKLQFSISDLDKVRSINLIPFHYDKEVGAAFHLTEVLENFLIFVPMGIYLQMLLPRTKLYVKFMLIAGTSFLLETMQYILAVGRSDITDVLTNTAGGLLGLAIYSMAARLIGNRIKANRLFSILAGIVSVVVITKYNAHTVIIKKENVDLHCLIAQVIDEIYPTLSANGNTAVFTAEDDLSVNADPEKLARVFSNLLRNAASYSYPQTEITISAKRLEHDIQITFENRGKTIPQEQLNSIFEKFNRLDDARLSNTGGAGLGLSIAEEIIHLHGGKITASSQNETIDFVITLPLSA